MSRGSTDSDARAVLTAAVAGQLDERVRDRIVAETGGNPLALLELARGMSATELGGGFVVPSTAALSGHLHEHYLRRVRALPEPTQRLMLLAAADPTGDATLLWRRPRRSASDRVTRGGRVGATARNRLPGALPPSAGAVGGLRGRHGRGSRAPCTARSPTRPTPGWSPNDGCGIWPTRASGPDENVAARARADRRRGSGPRGLDRRRRVSPTRSGADGGPGATRRPGVVRGAGVPARGRARRGASPVGRGCRRSPPMISSGPASNSSTAQLEAAAKPGERLPSGC